MVDIYEKNSKMKNLANGPNNAWKNKFILQTCIMNKFEIILSNNK